MAARELPGWRLLPLYLTPDGTAPSEVDYLAIDYGVVCEVIEGILDGRAALVDDARIVVTHYAQMLRRHIVSDSEIAELCREIYRQHKQALDLIIQHRPDQQTVIRDALVERIRATPDLALDRVGNYIDFAMAEWDNTVLTRGTGWTVSGRMLLFEFRNEPKLLRLSLILGPGAAEVRQRLFARLQRVPFRPNRQLKRYWNTVWQRDFLRPERYAAVETEDLIREIETHWQQFVGHDLPMLADAIHEEQWLWNAADAAEAAVDTRAAT